MKRFTILAALLAFWSSSAFGSKDDDSSPEVATAKAKVKEAEANLAKVQAKQSERKELNDKMKELADAVKGVHAARAKLNATKAKTERQLICDLADELCGPQIPVKAKSVKKSRKPKSKWYFFKINKARAKKHGMTRWDGKQWQCPEGQGFDPETDHCQPFAKDEAPKTVTKPSETPKKPSEVSEPKGTKPTMGHLRQLYKMGKTNEGIANDAKRIASGALGRVSALEPQVAQVTEDVRKLKLGSAFFGMQIETTMLYGMGGLGPNIALGLFVEMRNSAGTWGVSAGGRFATNGVDSPLAGGSARWFILPIPELMVEAGLAVDAEGLHQAKKTDGSSAGVLPRRIRFSVVLGVWGMVHERVGLGVQFFPGAIFGTRDYGGSLAFSVGAKFRF